MKTTIRLFSIVLAFLSPTLSPQARAVCEEGCLTNSNTVLGEDALPNPSGLDNTAVGAGALQSNGGNGWLNTAIGSGALQDNSTGFDNIAVGVLALQFNTSGSDNVAIGDGALGNGGNSNGLANIAIGHVAATNLVNGQDNTVVGFEAMVNLETGTGNIAVGSAAGASLTHGDNNIYIGNIGTRGENKKIRIGTTGTQTATFIAGISGATVPTGVPVIVDTTGHLGTTASSAHFKENIQPMDKASEAILALKPVTFRYKHELDPSATPQFGLVAEDVEKVNTDLVARDDHGKAYTVRYEAVNAMLLNEFLKEHRKNEEQRATIARLEKQVDALTAGLQKVSAQLQLSKPVSQTIANSQ
jgi:hypothetical protein